MLSGFTAADRHTGSTRNHLDFAPVGGTSRSSGHARKGLGGWAKQTAHERAHDRRRLLQEGAVFASPRIAHGHSSLCPLSSLLETTQQVGVALKGSGHGGRPIAGTR